MTRRLAEEINRSGSVVRWDFSKKLSAWERCFKLGLPFRALPFKTVNHFRCLTSSREEKLCCRRKFSGKWDKTDPEDFSSCWIFLFPMEAFLPPVPRETAFLFFVVMFSGIDRARAPDFLGSDFAGGWCGASSVGRLTKWTPSGGVENFLENGMRSRMAEFSRCFSNCFRGV